MSRDTREKIPRLFEALCDHEMGPMIVSSIILHGLWRAVEGFVLLYHFLGICLENIFLGIYLKCADQPLTVRCLKAHSFL